MTVAENMRAPDRAELFAATGIRDAAALLTQSMALSASSRPASRVGKAGGEVVCIFGVAPGNLVCGVGVPWMVGTEQLAAHAAHFLRACGPVVAEMGAEYAVLRNHVDARNHLAIRWLKWLGFTLDDPAPHGPFGLDFHKFEKAVARTGRQAKDQSSPQSSNKQEQP